VVFLSVISIRVPRSLKERMDRVKDRVKWSDEIRRFIEERLNEIEKEEVLRRVEELLEGLPLQPKGFASSLVREDRDSH